jgi:hypothetical protein
MNPTIVAPALQDLPVPRRANAVVEMSSGDALKHTIQMIFMALCCLVPAVFLWRSNNHGWAIVLSVLGTILFFSAFSKKALVAPCPFCSTEIYGILADKTKKQEVRCKQCYEYSLVQGGKATPMDLNTSADKPRFRSPVFEGAVWPPGCVACGATPTRSESLEDRSVNAIGLAMGRLIVSKASLSNVPYCDVHKNSVELIIRQDKKMDLKWCSLKMMRHYLALNRSKKSLGTQVTWNA